MDLHNKHVYSTISQMNEEKQGYFEILKEAGRFILITLAIVIPFRLFIAQPFIVSGDSMVPTFHNGEYLIVDELSFFLRTPARGEVVIFRYPKDPSKYFIKRVIGLPGETVLVEGGVLKITSTRGVTQVVSEPYISTQKLQDMKVQLADNQYFVMGDNRDESSDSRFWGPVPQAQIVGRAFARLLPVAEAGVLPGNFTPALSK